MFLEKIKEQYEALQENIKQKPTLAIFIMAGLAIMNISTILIREHTRELAVWIVIISIGLNVLWKKLTYVQPDYTFDEYFNALAPHVLESATFFCNADPIFHQVKSVEDITNNDYIYNENGDIYKFFFVKKEAANIDTEKLSTLGFKIERRINKRLQNRATRTIRTFDNLPPKVGVVGIEDTGGEVELSIYIANNPDKRRQLALLKQEEQDAKRVVTADVDKSDYDF